VAFLIIVLFGVIFPDMPKVISDGLDWLTVSIITLPIAVWMLRRKNRSLWWLCLWPIPIVWLVFLLLRSRGSLAELQA